MFEEIIAVVLGHFRKFLAHKTDMLSFPVWLCEAVYQYGKKFFQHDIHTVVFPLLAVDESQRLFACVVGVQKEIIIAGKRFVVQEFVEHPVPGIHVNRNLTDGRTVRQFKFDPYIPVKAFPLDGIQVKLHRDGKKAAVPADPGGSEFVDGRVLRQFIAEAENGPAVGIKSCLQVEADSKNPSAHIHGAKPAGKVCFRQSVPAAEDSTESVVCPGIHGGNVLVCFFIIFVILKPDAVGENTVAVPGCCVLFVFGQGKEAGFISGLLFQIEPVIFLPFIFCLA